MGERVKAFETVRLRSLCVEEQLLNEEVGALSNAEFAKLLGIKSR